jgi:hypothetical protein
MMGIFVAPLMMWICVSGIYSLFELYVRRKERMYLYERFGDKLNMETFKGKIGLPLFAVRPSFSGLKVGCLLVGVGLGLLTGLFLTSWLVVPGKNSLQNQELFGIAYGAPVLLFGGLGLIIAFLIEKKMYSKASE